MKQRLISVPCFPPQRRQFVRTANELRYARNRAVSPYHQTQTVSTLTLVATQYLPSPVGHGSKSSDDQLYPVLVTKEPAPRGTN